MKTLIIILAMMLSGCALDISDFKPQTEGSPTIPDITKTPEELLEEAINELKDSTLEEEMDFSYLDARMVNGDPEDVIQEDDGTFSLSLNQGGDSDEYVQTDTDLAALENFSLNIWFQTDDPTAIQTIFWQGVGDQNGWGAGTHNNTKAEFNVNLNHWSDTTGQVLAAFYGYNEGADNSLGSGELLPVSFPITRNPADGSYVLTGPTVSYGTNWNHLVVSVNQDISSTEIAVYFNGELMQAQIGTQVDNSQWDTLFRIGRPGTDTRKFSGKVSNYMLFDKVLSAEEVHDLYLYGRH